MRAGDDGHRPGGAAILGTDALLRMRQCGRVPVDRAAYEPWRAPPQGARHDAKQGGSAEQPLDAARRVGPHGRLKALIDANIAHKATGGVRSNRTREAIRLGLHLLFKQVRRRYPLENPARLDGRHLAYLYGWMEEMWRNGQAGIEPSLCTGTIKNYVSYLNHWCRWIGQPELARRAGVCFTDPGLARRQIAATRDKSWEGSGIDIGERVDRIYEEEPWVAMAVLAQHAFGLRRKEAVCLRPALAWKTEEVPGEPGRHTPGVILVEQGAKNGKKRQVRLWQDWQVEVAVVLQEWVREQGGASAALGPGQVDLKANLARYSRVLAKCGLTKAMADATGHGLRAGFACRMLESFGVMAPVRGASLRGADKAELDFAAHRTSVALGHGRTAATAYYIGARNVVLPEARPQESQGYDVQGVRERMRRERHARRFAGEYDKVVQQARRARHANTHAAGHEPGEARSVGQMPGVNQQSEPATGERT